MIYQTRKLERLLGNGIKIREENEKNTVVLQRRSLCTKRFIMKGEVIKETDLESLRPAPEYSFNPQEMHKIINKKAINNIEKGKVLFKEDLE